MTSNRRPSLTLSIVIYIDELGTRERSKEMTDDDLNDFLEIYWQAGKELRQTAITMETQHAVYFSDNFAIVDQILQNESNSICKQLLNMLPSIAMYQYNLAVYGHFLRGGIALGLAYAGDSIVVGPGLVDAVDLEEKVAVNPRIILHKDLDLLVSEQLQKDSMGRDEISELSELLLRDSDGRLFVNYLRIVKTSPASEIEERLMAHKDVVSENLQESDTARVFSKYRWAAEYHNYFCKSLGVRNPDILINAPNFNRPDEPIFWRA